VISEVISGKEYTTQSIKSFQLLPGACERNRDIYFQKSPENKYPVSVI